MPLQFVPNAWGPKLTTASGSVAYTQIGPAEIAFETGDCYYSVIMLSPQAARSVALGTQRKVEFSAPAGTLEIIPANADFAGEWRVPKRNILIGIDTKALRKMAEQEFGHSFQGVNPHPFGKKDDIAHFFGRLLYESFKFSDNVNELYVENLLNSYCIHIIREYSNASLGRNFISKAGLRPYSWRIVSEFMRENLSEKISLDSLASLTGLSPSHFRRAFRMTAGLPVHQYLLRLRLEAAERLLLRTDLPLMMVAQNCGFASQSHITTAMKQFRGITPGELRKLGQSLPEL